MLEGLAISKHSCDVIRLANLTHLRTFAAKMGLAIAQVADVVEFERDDVTKELMDDPFERKAKLGNKFSVQSRFSDGNWPVFYAATERDTAEKECTHHYGRKAAGGPDGRRSVHYSVVRCRYAGETVDLLPQLPTWPDLVSEDCNFCNQLGKEAYDGGLGGFIAPSARHPGGCNIPAFRRNTLSKPVITGIARFSYEADQTVIEYKDIP
jgi:hypothetical protein